ncbi:MAG TPA: TetR/AcrR family transcriptional regulator [Gemmatimonadales bacterium]|nr:TetR/AcrR family transcriptional regulator [Gemmatimonadales bacterium]
MTKFTRRAADRPDEILSAALTRFVEVGFAAARMEEIASLAGVSAGTIYRYFANKDALMGALVDQHLNPGWSRGREISEAYAARTAREIIELLLYRWAEELDKPESRNLHILIVREASLFPTLVQKYVSQLLEPGCLAIERALRHGIERGEFPVLAVEECARAMAMAVLGAVTWRTAFGAGLRGSSGPVRQTIAAVVRGIPGLRNSPPAAATVTQPMPPPGSRVVESATTAGGLRIVTLGPPTHESNR